MEDCTEPNSKTLCSATLISEDDDSVTYIKSSVWGPKLCSSNTHYREIDWPTHTQLRCYYDEHPIDGPPIPIAVKYDKKKNYWVTNGVVCSPSCNFSHLLTMQGCYDYSTLLEINMLMLRKCFRVTGDVWRAPDKRALQCYGGHLTIEEFRKECMQATYIPVTPPFMCYSMVFEKLNHVRSGMTNLPAAPEPEAMAVDSVIPDNDFETVPQETMSTTPAKNDSMVFKTTGLRIPARKKQDIKPQTSASNNFNQTTALYTTYLETKQVDVTDDKDMKAESQKRKRRPTKKKAKPAPTGGLMSFIMEDKK